MTLQPTNMPTANVDSSPVDSESDILQNGINTTDPAFIDPQVLEAMVSAQLPNNLVFTPLATVNTTLQGVPGDTITVPRWKFTGNVKDVKEGGKLPLFKLDQTSQQVKIKKAGGGFGITDEMRLSAYGDPYGEATRQLSLGLANHIDDDMMATALSAPLKVTKDAQGGDLKADLNLINAVESTFINNQTIGNDTTEQESMLSGVIVMNPLDANSLRMAAMENYTRPTQLGDNVLIQGPTALGEVLGWQLATSRKLKQGQAVAVKPGALGLYMKRGAQVETKREPDTLTTEVYASEFYATAINDEAKIAAITLTTPSNTAASSSTAGK